MQTTAIKFSPVNIEERRKLDIKSGDTIRVWSKIQEKGKTRLQAFEGLVLARKHGREPGATITVRKVSKGIGVEKIFPLYSVLIDKIEIIKRAKTRRSKLYFIREKAAKEIRRKMKALRFIAPDPEPEPDPEPAPEETSAEASTEKVEGGEEMKKEENAPDSGEEKTSEENTETPEDVSADAEKKNDDSVAESK
ncbi:50S ribosomal protein L19 [Candidatus Wolfebacteria bacterium]|nr:MAG: 50S ribosomal protein L19 [Candidatus Wolfebacteria bacterium]